MWPTSQICLVLLASVESLAVHTTFAVVVCPVLVINPDGGGAERRVPAEKYLPQRLLRGVLTAHLPPPGRLHLCACNSEALEMLSKYLDDKMFTFCIFSVLKW